MKKIPIMQDKIEFDSLGFYELLRSQECALSGLSTSKVIATGELPYSRISKQQIVGEFFHSLLDQAKVGVDRNEIVKISEKIIQTLLVKYKRYFELNNTDKIDEWSEISMSMRHALGRFKIVGTKGKGVIEELLYSKNKKFKGKPDLYIIEDQNSVVIDYKSSSIFTDGIPDPRYVSQLEFYSLLIFDNYELVKNVECKLIGLKGEEHIFVLQRESSYSDLLKKFDKDYEMIKLKINSPQATFFSDQSCKYCNYKVVCPSFLANQDKLQNSSDLFILKGKLLKKEIVNQSGVLVFDSGRLLIPTSHENYTFFELGKYYCGTDLVKRLDGFTLTKHSEFYEY